MSGRPRTVRLTLSSIGLGSCLRVGLLGGMLAGVVVFFTALVLWMLTVSGLQQTVGAAFSGSQAQIAAILGPGTAIAVATTLAVLTAAGVTLGTLLLPVLYQLAARRTSGIGLTLAPTD